MLDCFSNGRIISGFVRGTAVESLTGGIIPAENRARFEEAHDLIIKCWTQPGPFPLRRPVLPLPRRQPMGAAHPRPAPAHLVPRPVQRRECGLGRPPPAPLHELGIAAGLHRGTEGRLHRHGQRGRLHARPGAFRLPAAGVLRDTDEKAQEIGETFLWTENHRNRGPAEHNDPPGYQSREAVRIQRQLPGAAASDAA